VLWIFWFSALRIPAGVALHSLREKARIAKITRVKAMD